MTTGSDALTRESLAEALTFVGLRQGDTVIVHSSFRSFGAVEGGPETLLDALLDVLGPQGNLVLPTFNYSRPPPVPHYDPAVTPSRAGVLTEVGRRRPGAVRSLHPSHSVTVIGPDAMTADSWATALSVLGAGGLELVPADLEVILITSGGVTHRR